MKKKKLPCAIVAIDSEEDWELDDLAGALFTTAGVRPDRHEQNRYLCVQGDDEVLGALAIGLYSSSPDENDPLGRPRFSFSAVVAESGRRKGVARGLVQAMLNDHPRDEMLIEGKVINPHMAKLMESMGFVYDDDDRDDEWTDLDRRIGRRMYLP